MPFTLDLHLAADTHEVGELGLSQLLLMDDARFPWLILVPRIVGARELIDLDAGDRVRLFDEVAGVARALESLLRPDKLNVAALGNVVPQLHVHVIARFRTDPAWPQPVWGRGERTCYGDAAARERITALRGVLATMLA
jgi:diadenosine tetraphosphate (Ap4A) HIT family hydrolase